MGQNPTVDWRLFRWVNSVQDATTWAHRPVRIYTQAGVGLFAVLLLLGWWMARRQDAAAMATALWAGAAALLALGLNQIVGHAVGRARPYTTHAAVHLLVSRTSDFSFPSDHAAVAGAVAVGLVMLDRRLGIVGVVAALAMAFSRVYVGAHYPGDVLAGLVVGGSVAIAGRPLAVRALTPLLGRLARSPVRALVTAKA